ncbi:MAG: peptide deformylase [Candidatus Cloacimonetes bacterium]|jgi:peptide deformylase|nr:peptide deformylase [Candidatus Cloacimonadota bacterium]MBT7469911.1 peptide deformylase [Candidatus Cloacimonadota bacterium]
MFKNKILDIRIYGDKVLRQVARPVKEITPEIEQFIQNLIATMYEKDGVGLAAPQVGKPLRIFVVDPFWVQENGKKTPLVFINPEFVEFVGNESNEEGCLSIPDVFENVNRAKKVKIKGTNEKGEKVKYIAEGLFSRSLQHEYDHLEGILFIDKIASIKKMFNKKKLREIQESTDKNGINIGK